MIDDLNEKLELNDNVKKLKIEELEKKIEELQILLIEKENQIQNKISSLSESSESENENQTIQEIRKKGCGFTNCDGSGNTNGKNISHRKERNCPLALKAKKDAAKNNQLKTFSAAIPVNFSDEKIIADLRTEIFIEKTNNMILRVNINSLSFKNNVEL